MLKGYEIYMIFVKKLGILRLERKNTKKRAFKSSYVKNMIGRNFFLKGDFHEANCELRIWRQISCEISFGFPRETKNMWRI